LARRFAVHPSVLERVKILQLEVLLPVDEDGARILVEELMEEHHRHVLKVRVRR
jgi:hypothetical protein